MLDVLLCQPLFDRCPGGGDKLGMDMIFEKCNEGRPQEDECLYGEFVCVLKSVVGLDFVLACHRRFVAVEWLQHKQLTASICLSPPRISARWSAPPALVVVVVHRVERVAGPCAAFLTGDISYDSFLSTQSPPTQQHCAPSTRPLS